MKAIKKLNVKRSRRAARTRAKITGTAERPRLAVRRSNRYFYAQLIDDAKGHTIVSASSFSLGGAAASGGKKTTKSENAFAIGELLGKKAKEKGIGAAVFDRRSYKFHGRVKSFVDGAKKSGLTI